LRHLPVDKGEDATVPHQDVLWAMRRLLLLQMLLLLLLCLLLCLLLLLPLLHLLLLLLLRPHVHTFAHQAP